MKKIHILISMLILCSCQEAEKVVNDPKVQKDSETLVEDLIDLAEEDIDHVTGIKIDVQLPKGKDNASSQK